MPDTALTPHPPRDAASSPQPRRRRRAARVLRIVGIGLVGILVVVIGAVLIWANQTFAATETGWDAARADTRITVRDDGDRVVLEPVGGASGAASAPLGGHGLVFLAGAKVDPHAYASTFRDLAAEGVTVVVVRPILNLAIIEWRDLSEFTGAAPDVTTWAVGGHSQGGVKACSYAADPDVSALVLLGSYCALDDLSERADLSVISVTGSRDGLLREEDAAGARSLLPADAAFVELVGVNHAQFGDYGDQPGDREAEVTDDAARAAISAALVDFFAVA